MMQLGRLIIIGLCKELEIDPKNLLDNVVSKEGKTNTLIRFFHYKKDREDGIKRHADHGFITLIPPSSFSKSSNFNSKF